MAVSCWWAPCTPRPPAPPSTSWTAAFRSAWRAGTSTCTGACRRGAPAPPSRAGARAPRGGDVLHRLRRAVRVGGFGRLGGSRGRGLVARPHAAHLQHPRDTAHRGARAHAPRRRRLLPVGEARLRTFLGLLERVALLGLLADRHGELSRPVPAIFAVLPAGTGTVRGVARSAGADLGSHLAQSAGHAGHGDGVGVVRRRGARAVRGAGGGGGGTRTEEDTA